MTQITVRSLPPNGAQKLADLFLPVRLRDFYVKAHPLIQCYLYDQSTSPEEFFILVDMEYQRFSKMNMRYSLRDSRWKPIVVNEKQLEFDAFKPKLEYNLSSNREGVDN